MYEVKTVVNIDVIVHLKRAALISEASKLLFLFLGKQPNTFDPTKLIDQKIYIVR